DCILLTWWILEDEKTIAIRPAGSARPTPAVTVATSTSCSSSTSASACRRSAWPGVCLPGNVQHQVVCVF
ncbi:hypothetical protein, partial [Pseudomonas aeruginosa]|uniref:hypothetical protein n=1 Tax=Pseudomonas aeruginosa TaxID=287 RepID=UPI001F333C5D